MAELSEEAKAELHEAIHIVRTDKFESWFRKAHPGQPMPADTDKVPPTDPKVKDAPKNDKTPPKKEEPIDPPKPRKGLWAVGYEGDDDASDS